MAALDPTKSRVMEFVAAFVIIAFTSIEAFTSAAPYFGLTPTGGDIATLAQQQTLVQAIMIAIVSFLFGASVGSQTKDQTAATLASTNANLQAATTPPSTTIPVNPGDTVAVHANATPTPAAAGTPAGVKPK